MEEKITTIEVNTEKKSPVDYLSLDNSNCLKGILAICIFLCHCWGRICLQDASLTESLFGLTVGRILTVLGYLAVALFFFLSGYGLMVQYQKKGNDYLKGFFLRRVLPLYLLCLLFIALYTVENWILYDDFNWKTIVQSLLFGGTVIRYGWYFQSILLWYIFFFLCFRFIKKDGIRLILLCVAYVLYVALCLILRLDSTWYEGCFCLIIGILWAKYKGNIDEFFASKKIYILSLCIALVLFVATLLFGNFPILPEALRIVVKAVSACVFVALVALILKILPIRNLLTRSLGKISLDLYLTHGFFLVLFQSKYVFIQNPWLYALVTLLSTLVASCLIHPLTKRILSLFRKKD